jgi:hypothetical protein
MSHQIRLRGFWSVTANAEGGYRHIRRFGRPRTLDPDERVWLTGEQLAGAAQIILNGQMVGRVLDTGRTFAFDITRTLRPRNELMIDSTGSADVAELFLEIRRAGE